MAHHTRSGSIYETTPLNDSECGRLLQSRRRTLFLNIFGDETLGSGMTCDGDEILAS